jgi:two-component system chemotaxis response regulator CheB
LRSTHRLKERVRAQAGVTPVALKPRRPRAPIAPPVAAKEKPAPAAFGLVPGAVLVGSSTGGPPALDALLASLPATFPWPVLIAQHMPATFTGPLSRRLDQLCALNVCEVTKPVPLSAGQVYVAAGDADMIIAKRPAGLVVQSVPMKREYRWHPSVNRLVESALEHLPPDRLTGVLMTGMGDDGARAMTTLRRLGGHTIAEAKESAVVWGMPGALVQLDGAEFTAPLATIGKRLVKLVGAR